MKWITLNNGDLVNLDNIMYICVARGLTVEYYDNTGTPIVEIFKDNAEANERMEYLQKLLTEEG